jgi:hypothetical protein
MMRCVNGVRIYSASERRCMRERATNTIIEQEY